MCFYFIKKVQFFENCFTSQVYIQVLESKHTVAFKWSVLFIRLHVYVHTYHTQYCQAIHACKEKQSPSTITWSENNPNILRGAIMMSPHNAIHSKRSCLKCCLYQAITFFNLDVWMHVSKDFFLLQSSVFIPFEEEKVLKSINVYFVKTEELRRWQSRKLMEYRKQHELLWGRPQLFVNFCVPLIYSVWFGRMLGVH